MRKRDNRPGVCDWESGQKGTEKRFEETAFYKHRGDFSWNGISNEKYKPSGKDWADIVRKTLIGNHNETTRFHLRYFEIAPGGYSSFEMHTHEHVIIGIRGKGCCLVRNKKYTISFLDTLYIEPKAPHQLKNPFHEPFGFFCMVNAKRDKPKLLSDLTKRKRHPFE